MEYLISFDDGSSAFLAHHGVKGMKWGVWNDETKSKYGGGDSSAKGAKRTIRDLNRLDKRRAVEVGKAAHFSNSSADYAKRSAIAEKHGRMERAAKLKEKSVQAGGRADAHYNAVKGIVKQQNNLSVKLVKEGYSVKTKNITRSTMTKGEKALSLALTAAMAASPSPVVVYTDTRTSGTKYKLQKNK